MHVVQSIARLHRKPPNRNLRTISRMYLYHTYPPQLFVRVCVRCFYAWGFLKKVIFKININWKLLIKPRVERDKSSDSWAIG